MSLPDNIVFDMFSPKTGSQTLTKQSSTVYSGYSGSFDAVILVKVTSGGVVSWETTVMDYTQGSPIYGSTTWLQETAGSDPRSNYWLNGESSEGTASISEP